ncbi:MAG: hypothetical protein K5639_07580 [Eubacterium sp.]|nr:hypothetical protein [Eubacterium sp.]
MGNNKTTEVGALATTTYEDQYNLAEGRTVRDDHTSRPDPYDHRVISLIIAAILKKRTDTQKSLNRTDVIKEYMKTIDASLSREEFDSRMNADDPDDDEARVSFASEDRKRKTVGRSLDSLVGLFTSEKDLTEEEKEDENSVNLVKEMISGKIVAATKPGRKKPVYYFEKSDRGGTTAPLGAGIASASEHNKADRNTDAIRRMMNVNGSIWKT